jgi:hypothetical protein
MRAKTLLTLLFLLSLGVAGFIFLQAMAIRSQAQEGPEALVAAAALEPRTLLRAQDVTWRRLTGPVTPGAILRPTEAQRAGKPLLDDETRATVYGAVLRAAIEADLCDLVMFPVGPFVDARYVDEILPLARARDVGTVCFKAFGAGKLLGDTAGYNQPLQRRPRGKLSSGGSDDAVATLPRLGVAECLHYTLTLDPDVALLGLGFANEQEQAFAAMRTFRPLDAAAMADVRRRAAEARRDKGPCWWNPDPDA